ncbi:predicted protein [Aspergillus nidulans FGSC A4]|uniref:6-phosphogluconate dehydrogenase NADP-binding domain-containing protein n=1 Tax=Emericella nidulans (strain FGSC A4 / ATCC 38163 / CBS 112.46 / NRRL 194 / M139) TaxID=227321 RepID=Q5B242_EMENI|nr:hypothetical protein [Aspergillus nidulans FGSC A4]EAA62548.1 predicted protein [Aspergillus nidulans FGSC A4]CBF81990.1 TPA: conserved hypothetical protein [Aspergillus nidulans FGSC A4]|eukprot:XP_662992.1 predicted protein [Aspergillus nidulans FGSC A4]
MKSHSVNSKAVSILGIGQMGSAPAHAFLKAGYRTPSGTVPKTKPRISAARELLKQPRRWIAVGTPILASDLPERVPVLDNDLIYCMEGVFSGFVQGLALVGAAGLKETEFTN